MKTLEVVIEMAFFVLKEFKFRFIFCKMPAKIQFFEIILRTYLSERKNALEKLNHTSFVTWAVTENPKFRVCVESVSRKKIEHLKFGC